MNTSPPTRTSYKREADYNILGGWIDEGARVLDLGCGRGIFLEYLQKAKHIRALGVDFDETKVRGCVERGVPVVQDDVWQALDKLEKSGEHFDWIVCSRTIEEMGNPSKLLSQALRVADSVAVGFSNNGFWKNRVSLLLKGTRVSNKIRPNPWEHSNPSNAVSIGDFEAFCRKSRFKIRRRAFLAGDWQTPCKRLPRLLAGYAIYEISR